MDEVSVAITDLVKFCHRRGDIDHRFSPSPTGEQGIASHQFLYRRRAKSYCPEFPVEFLSRELPVAIRLRGRADGYDPEAGYVEEIKTCRVSPHAIPETTSRMHLSQARLYAAIITAQEQREEMEVRLTWFNIDSGEEISLVEQSAREELDQFLSQSLAQFSEWLHRLARLRQCRDNSIELLDFPHGSFRPGQRELAELTYKCIDQGGQLLLEAPTGIGKTMAILFPALKALATGKHERMVFVTSKTVGRLAAEDALALLGESGYRGSALSLTARDKICLSPGSACHGDDCPYARGYYDRLPEAMVSAIERPQLRRQDIESVAKEYRVCPYELSLDLLPWVDIVVADIHYVYSLGALLGGLFDSAAARWSVLVDEAHNLDDRAREMFGARLFKSGLMQARKSAGGTVLRTLNGLNRALLDIQKEPWQEPAFDSREQVPEGLNSALQLFVAAVSEQLAAQATYLRRRPELMDFFFDVLQFLRVIDHWDDDFRLELSRDDGRQSLCVRLACLDPARLLGHGHRRAHAVVAFSATLSPMDWSRTSLGLEQDAVCFRAQSPFTRDQLKVDIVTTVDTRFRQRTASLPALAATLLDWLSRVPGNCIVYFPSYRYLQECLAVLSDSGLAQLPRHLWRQEPGVGEPDREQLLALLKQRSDVAAFCILGGVYGEGIDLPGEQLASIVVIGVGMPQLNRRTRQLQLWYQQRYGSGFEYVFLYPGMQKVDQALGRVVRRAQDTGRALLIDPRYDERTYRELLPPWWEYST